MLTTPEVCLSMSGRFNQGKSARHAAAVPCVSPRRKSADSQNFGLGHQANKATEASKGVFTYDELRSYAG